MKKSILWRYMSLLLLVSYLIGCTKGGGSTFTNVNPQILKYFDYKLGTYWIYRDSITGNLDSVAVLEIDDALVSAGLANYDDRKTFDFVDFENGIEVPSSEIDWSLERNNICFYYPFQPPLNLANWVTFELSYPFTTLDSLTASLELNGIAYNKVFLYTQASTTQAVDSPLQTYAERAYICDSLGIVKLDLFHSSDSTVITNIHWELLRCHVLH